MSNHVLSLPQWAHKGRLADDAKSMAVAVTLIRTGQGPRTTKINEHTGVKVTDNAAWLEKNAWAAYLASLPPSERAWRKAEAEQIVGDVTHTAKLFDRYRASQWCGQMTFPKWLKRRQRLKDRHSPRHVRKALKGRGRS